MALLYCKEIINHKIGDNTPFEEVAKSMGWTLTIKESDVEQAYDGSLWEKGYAPEKPIPTQEEQSEKRAEAYRQEVDPITCHIQRLEDEEQTPEIEQEIADLKQERSDKVEDIKRRYPYPVGG